MATPIPAQAAIKFNMPAGKLFVDTLVNPDGAPTDVLDKDVGFTVTGRVVLPNSVVGKGLVTLAADEIGGPFDGQIALTAFSVDGGDEPGPITYYWTIKVVPVPVTEVDKMYHLSLVFVLQTLAGKHTDIGAFFDMGAYLVV